MVSFLWLSRRRELLAGALLCAVLSGCGGNDPINEGSGDVAIETVSLAAGPNSDVENTGALDSEVPNPEASQEASSEIGPCDDLPDKAAIEKVMGVKLSDPVEKPVGCELRGVENTSDVANFTRQTVSEKNATLKYLAETGSAAPTDLGDAALPGAVVALSYSVLFDKGETSYLTQVVVGDGPAGSGTPKAVELMKLWVG
jgi:hypothetical protein